MEHTTEQESKVNKASTNEMQEIDFSALDLPIDLNEYRARTLVEDGKHMISEGDLDGAIGYFQKSLERKPNAEGYTYLGWVLSLKGQFDEAIELCKKAICIDSKFGNPFNDIGSYLIQKSQFEDAIPWLQEAKLKPKYEPRHFPYVNLGRIYSELGRIDEAIEEFEGALEFAPGHPEIEKVLEQLENIKSAEVNA